MMGNLILKSMFCSYFIVSLISFWNISLLFNFLTISSVPTFTKDFLEMLAVIFFKQNTLLDWIVQVFQLKEDTFLFESDKIVEKMEEERNGRAWFGKMGMSTNFLSNGM